MMVRTWIYWHLSSELLVANGLEEEAPVGE
jgi:hypothetical protein